MKLVVTSNITKLAARYRRMARNLPGIVDRAMGDLVRDEAVPLFQNTTRTWVNRPSFEPVKTPRGWAVGIDPIYPWKYVDEGTRVRRAIMSRDWKSKTKSNVITSYAGRGRVVFISRKVNLPGIQARNFRDIIMRRIQARAARAVRDALNQASYGAGQGL